MKLSKHLRNYNFDLIQVMQMNDKMIIRVRGNSNNPLTNEICTNILQRFPAEERAPGQWKTEEAS